MANTFDGINKLIILGEGTTSLSIRELYSEWVDWVALSDNSKYLPAFRTVGGDSISSTKELGITFFMINDWKIRPYEGNHRLLVEGNVYTDPYGSSIFVPTLGNYNIVIETTVSNLSDSSLAQMPEIEYASYNGGVTIDTVNGIDSSVYPYGTPLHPCKTLANSYAIRMARGFKKIYLISDLTLTGIPDGVLDNLHIIGTTGNRTHTLIIDNVLATNCIAENLNVTGNFKPGSTTKANNCNIYDATNVQVQATKCTIQGGTYSYTELDGCSLQGEIKLVNNGILSGIDIVFEGDETTIDMQGYNNCTVSLNISSGYFKLLNSRTGCLAEFNLRGGEIELDNTCTGGYFYAEGYGTLFGNPETLGMTVKANHLVALETIPGPILDETLNNHLQNGSVGKAISTSSTGGVDVDALADAISSSIKQKPTIAIGKLGIPL